MSRFLPHSTTGLLRAWPASALALWTGAWQAGLVSPDDVLHTLSDYADVHELDDPAAEHSRSALDLMNLVRTAPLTAVVLPAPGDAQGLPPGVMNDDVQAAGEVLLLTRPHGCPVALTARGTPERCRWTARTLDVALDVEAVGSEHGVGEVEYELRDAVTEAAAVIAGLAGPRSAGPADLRDALAARTQAAALDLPPHDRQRVDRMLATAGQIDAIVDLAGGGLGASASQLESADAQLRQLSALTRRARAIAINALLRDYRR
ncbi:MAG: serine/threonine protein kinase [Gordonia sp. (in: high G+C Gram-positive bacteria)]|uniref:serine/threonine protein kinase n=1 Tax=Gordonia sp. (in: high G+C Gram-positive bacteria) TaxID=84139 RepID=UPI003BB6C010